MKVLSRLLVVTAFWAIVVSASDNDKVFKSVHGNITKLDPSSKSMVVKTRGGAELNLTFVESTTVHGMDKGAAGSMQQFKGLSEGSEVVVHYWEGDGQKNAYEVDKVGLDKEALKYVDGKVTKVGNEGSTVVVKTISGAEMTFDVVGTDTAASAKSLGKAAAKASTVTVYYTETSGKKIAHFFEKL